jgi:lipopolysaccharide/colanic/teichoic acid biosynthesis glycosyltransferase
VSAVEASGMEGLLSSEPSAPTQEAEQDARVARGGPTPLPVLTELTMTMSGPSVLEAISVGERLGRPGEPIPVGPGRPWAPHATIDPARQFRAKRILDLAICLVALPAAAIVFGLIALAIRLDSPGSILFVQERVGYRGRPFSMFKFRTLRHDHDPAADTAFMQAFIRGHHEWPVPTPTMINKPVSELEVTRVGRFLRRTSLDELPQIINILRGEMSVVGPRPNVPCEVEAYKEWHRERLEAVPGVTGLAQVRGRSWLSFEEIAVADIEYVRNQSLALDLRILVWTVRAVLGGGGAG